MAQIFPFRALRYNPARVSYQQVLTQPYDKITPAMQARYYAENPYNLVRLELGRAEPGDNGQNVYTRAAAALTDWRRQEVLLPDPEPSIYIYSQTFTVPGGSQPLARTGFIALGRLEDYSAGVVFRHEQTLSKPKADRLNLLRATRAHSGQIFMLYSDPAGDTTRLLRPAGAPVTDLQDEYGVRHQLWRISDQETIASLQRLMADKPLLIADGHHRYETALAYRDESRAAGRNGAGAERLMMTFVNMDSPGVVILPTHRVVRGLAEFAAEEFFSSARNFFAIEPLAADADALAALRQAGEGGTAFVAATHDGIFLLRARAGAAASVLFGVSTQQAALDVVQLHRVLLQHVLGISEQAIRDQTHVEYLRDAAEALARVRAGADVAFLMNPVRIAQLRALAFAGEVMPQKSTDFYPKLLSGIAIYALD